MIGFARFDPEAFRRRLMGYSDLEFDAEFQRFLQPDTGRAWRTRMDAYDHTQKNSERLYDHMTEHNLAFNQKNFEIAAIAVADEISVTLFHEDIGSAWTSNTIIHDGGGNRAEQVRLGSEGGIAGMTKPDASADLHQYSEAETHRLVKKLNSSDYLRLLNDSPNFRAAVQKYIG